MSVEVSHSHKGPRTLRDAENAVRVVEALVASAFSIKPQDIRHERRGSADSAFARQVAMYLSHTRCGLTFTTTARLFGRDRTTAAYACRMVEERRENPCIDQIVDRLERALDGCRDLANAGGAIS